MKFKCIQTYPGAVSENNPFHVGWLYRFERICVGGPITSVFARGLGDTIIRVVDIGNNKYSSLTGRTIFEGAL